MWSIQKLMTQLRKSETGFTLVELLVVVGIIVALAAVIIPNVAKFTSKGTEGANAAEHQNVQTAIDTLMADAGIAGIDALSGIGTTAIQDFDTPGLPTNGGPILVNLLPVDAADYMRGGTLADPTTNFYCWGGDGLVSRHPTAITPCP